MIALFCHKIFLTNSAKYIVHVAFLLCLLATDVNIIHRDYYGRVRKRFGLSRAGQVRKQKTPPEARFFQLLLRVVAAKHTVLRQPCNYTIKYAHPQLARGAAVAFHQYGTALPFLSRKHCSFIQCLSIMMLLSQRAIRGRI
ncbi:hypothetical protein AUN08_13615 [Cronobacter sakazakii]|nr:hypothetical protein [Cronobacter sakazakii]